MGILRKQYEQQQKSQKDERRNEPSKKHKPAEPRRSNQVVYLARTGWNFYAKLFSEVVLGLFLALPVYAFFYFKGVKEVTLSVDLPTLWAIATISFVLQSLMFGRKG